MPEGFFLFLFSLLISTFQILVYRALYLLLFPPEVVLCQVNLIQLQSAKRPATAH